MTDSPKPRNPITLHIEGCDVSRLWAKSKPGTPAPPTDVPRPRLRRRRYSAAERLLAITPVLDYRRVVCEFGYRPHWLPLPDGSILRSRRALRSMTALVAFIAARTWISKSSIWKWCGQWLRGGSLRDKPRADGGESRYFKANPSAADFVRSVCVDGRSVRAIHQALGAPGRHPSYETVRLFVRREVLQ